MSTETQLPKVQLPDNWQLLIRQSAKEKRVVAVSKDEEGAALAWLQKSRASEAQVLRPAKKGDVIELDFEVRIDDKTIDGGEARNHHLILGDGGYIPGFEDGLLGMETGQEKNFSLDAPQDYLDERARGKRLDFHVKVHAVKDRKLPELTDDFARSVGKFENIKALYQSLRDGLRAEKEEKEKQRLRLIMLETIDKEVRAEVPQQFVKDEVRLMIGELQSSLGAMGMPLDAYLGQIKKTLQDLEKEFEPEALRRVRYGLILAEIARREGFEPTNEEVEAEANKFLLRFKSAEEAGKNIDVQTLTRYTKNVLRNEKAFQYLESVALS